MSWNSWADFLAMGGYALYVWGSLGMCAAAILAEVVSLKARRMSMVREIIGSRSAQLEELDS